MLAGRTAGDSTVALSWTAPSSNGGSAVTGYRVYRGTSSGVGDAARHGRHEHGLQRLHRSQRHHLLLQGQCRQRHRRRPALQRAFGDAGDRPRSAQPEQRERRRRQHQPRLDRPWLERRLRAHRLPHLPRNEQRQRDPPHHRRHQHHDTTTRASPTAPPTTTRWSAINLLGDSARSNERSATPTAALTVPSAPVLTSAVGGNNTVNLTWTPPTTDGGSPVSGYRILRGTAAGTETQIATVGRSRHRLQRHGRPQRARPTTTRSPQPTCWATAPARTSAAPPPPPAPGAPTLNTATGGNNNVALTWTAPASTGGATRHRLPHLPRNRGRQRNPPRQRRHRHHLHRHQRHQRHHLLLPRHGPERRRRERLLQRTQRHPRHQPGRTHAQHRHRRQQHRRPHLDRTRLQRRRDPDRLPHLPRNQHRQRDPPGQRRHRHHLHRHQRHQRHHLLLPRHGTERRSARAPPRTNAAPPPPPPGRAHAQHRHRRQQQRRPHLDRTRLQRRRDPDRLPHLPRNRGRQRDLPRQRRRRNDLHRYDRGERDDVLLPGERHELRRGERALARALRAARHDGRSSDADFRHCGGRQDRPRLDGALERRLRSPATASTAEPRAAARLLLTNAGGSTTTYTDTSATNGTTYYYEVSAVNAVGEGLPSNERSATPVASSAVPTAPTLMSATPGNSVTLVWSAPASTGGSPITGYNIYRGTTSGGENLLLAVGNVTTYTDETTTDGTTYYYQVSAVNASGESARSIERSATPHASDTTPPSTPSGLKVLLTGTTQIALGWNPSTDNTGVTAYQIFRNGSLVGTVGLSRYLASGLAPGASYTFQVRALDAAGNQSPASTSLSARRRHRRTGLDGNGLGRCLHPGGRTALERHRDPHVRGRGCEACEVEQGRLDGFESGGRHVHRDDQRDGVPDSTPSRPCSVVKRVSFSRRCSSWWNSSTARAPRPGRSSPRGVRAFHLLAAFS